MTDNTDLLKELPDIRRAREYHLYDNKGNRYLDLYQNNGRAILGHRPNGVSLALKSNLSKGLLAEYPSVYGNRLYKKLISLFPEYRDFRVYRNMDRALKTVSNWFGREIAPFDPVFTDTSGSKAALWRPFCPITGESPDILFPVFPFPGSFAPVSVCFRKDTGKDLPVSDMVSPVLLAALLKAVCGLESYKETFTEDVWRAFDSSLWTRNGPYLIMNCRKDEYPEIFRAFLKGGIFISPEHPGVSIVPGEFTSGEIKPIKKIEGKYKNYGN